MLSLSGNRAREGLRRAARTLPHDHADAPLALAGRGPARTTSVAPGAQRMGRTRDRADGARTATGAACPLRIGAMRTTRRAGRDARQATRGRAAAQLTRRTLRAAPRRTAGAAGGSGAGGGAGGATARDRRCGSSTTRRRTAPGTSGAPAALDARARNSGRSMPRAVLGQTPAMRRPRPGRCVARSRCSRPTPRPGSRTRRARSSARTGGAAGSSWSGSAGGHVARLPLAVAVSVGETTSAVSPSCARWPLTSATTCAQVGAVGGPVAGDAVARGERRAGRAAGAAAALSSAASSGERAAGQSTGLTGGANVSAPLVPP
jgi:hypothetical protein